MNNGVLRAGERSRDRQPLTPRPETPVTQSRVPWREVGRIPETPPGVPTGFGLAVSGGSLPKLAIDSGDRGRAVQLAINHLAARPSEEVQAAFIPKPDLGTHTNEIEGTCSPWVFLRTNAPSAAVPQSDAFCHVPTFVTTGAPPGNRTIM